MADLEVTAERRNAQSVLAVSGELDLATVPVLQEAISEQLAAAEAPAEIVLDLSGLAFLDSSGLGALLRIREEIGQAGGRLRICAVGPAPARVISIAGLAGTFGLDEE